MKIILLYALLLGAQLYSQTPLSPDLMSYPVSPDAAKFALAGNIPVNQYYGQVNHAIELFSGKEGDFSFRLALNYNYAGNRVEESPSLMGLGWSLNMGGSISREVRGLPDEHYNGYYGSTVIQSMLSTYFTNGTITKLQAQKINDGEFDSEADRFTVGVNGINFSFKIGADGSPCFLSKHNYRVEIQRPSSAVNQMDIIGFIVTDTLGNRYYFERSDAETNENTGSDSYIFSDMFQNYVSSWQLSRIIASNGSAIEYEYEDDDFYSYSFYAIGTFKGLGPQGNTEYSSGGSKVHIKRKVLKEIHSPSFHIYLNLTTKQNQKVYSSIELKDYSNTVIRILYEFVYGGPRNCLTSITKNGHFLQSFDYHTITTPFINSIIYNPWNQDEWGFANGANNLYGVNIPATQYHADKSPNFNTTVAGALNRITYSTGGFTQLQYEQNEIASSGSPTTSPEPNVRIHLAFKSDNVLSGPAEKIKTFTKTFTTDVVATLRHRIENNYGGEIEMNIIRTGPCTSANYHIAVPQGRILSPLPVICPSLGVSLNDGCMAPQCIEERDSGGKFIIPAGTYTFKFRSGQNNTANVVKGEITLDFYDPAITDSLDMIPPAKKVGGIRLAKTLDYPAVGNPIVTEYEYRGGTLFSTLNPSYSFNWTHGVLDGSLCIRFMGAATTFNAKSYNAMLHSGTPVYYSRVRKYQGKVETIVPKKFMCTNCSGGFGGNYDGSKQYSYIAGIYGFKKIKYLQGYTETLYAPSSRSPNSASPFQPAGDDLSLGRIIGVSSTLATDSQYVNKVLAEDLTEYRIPWGTNEIVNNSNYPKSLKIGLKRRLTGCIFEFELPITDFFKFVIYKEFDDYQIPETEITTEYFDDKTIQNTTSRVYDNYNQVHKVTKSLTDGAISEIEVNYPYNDGSTVSTAMVTKNIISSVIQVTEKINDQIIGITKFEYQQLSSYLYKPVAFFKSRGTGILERRNIFLFDSKGNIKQKREVTNQGAPSGLHNPNSEIIWGYNQTLPLAIIERGTISLLSSALVSDLQQLSNTGTEAALLVALDNLRALLPEAKIKTFTHIPLIGMSTQTDEKGQRTSYTYDTLGRLTQIRDTYGNLLSETTYNTIEN